MDWLEKKEEWKRNAQKLHIQFRYGSEEKLEKLVRDANKSREEKMEVYEFCEVLKQVCINYNICPRLKRNPRKPVAGLRLGGSINEMLLMDLGELEGYLFLVIVDKTTH